MPSVTALRPLVLLRRLLIFIHRWLGVALSAVLMLWFLSGIVMMYWSFPSVSPQDRLARAPTLDPTRITLSAADAFAAAGHQTLPFYTLLTSFDGRPMYLGDGGRMTAYADGGAAPGGIDQGVIDRAAATWSGRPVSEATKTSVEEVDQWTVAGELRALRPLYKYAWPDGQHVYVNGRNGDVVQYTTTASRFWAYLGAIPHWLYFTPLRTHQRQWYATVFWSALIGGITALLGVVIALWMYSPRQRYRHQGAPTGIPYRGWKRWHTIAGLVFGIFTATWAFSGVLSMGPFRIMDRLAEAITPAPSSRGSAGRNVASDLSRALRGGTLPAAAYAGKDPAAAIASVPGFDARELEYTSFAGEAIYLIVNGRGETRIVPVRGEPMATFDAGDLIRRLRSATRGALAEIRLLEQYDAYYTGRPFARPLPVILARADDALGTRYYIDPRTATIVTSHSSRDWVTRWLYRGLHSFDFPWLMNYRPLWDIVVITLMLGGAALCATSLVLAWRVVTRRLAALWRRRLALPNEDLAVETE